ncbi:MAG: MBL fold hydrolase [Pelagibacteraceae bacterium]|nr:MBL fold hydrolase [Pelagibacteraceae bacterium]|tara:strand:+ start:14662 stop:16356 length:1695 start_codon:yes stop_codon:yes gene_type:complete
MIVNKELMIQKTINANSFKKGLFFLSLGGIGEIGANCYLYGCDGKWIMIDLGLSFADEKFPGIDLLIPKIDFIEIIKNDLIAVIISHGHEDHAGAVSFLSDKINCPVYATSFAKLLIENRLKEFGKLESLNLKELDTKKNLELDNFNLEFLETTHSIPQPNAIVIKTIYGQLLHTADWKIDSSPVIGEKFNENLFKNLGNQGLLALIGDSTNADVPGTSKSENDVREELKNIFSRFAKRIVVTCFSSNIARMINIVYAAKKNNRKVLLVGRSMKKNIEAAIKCQFIESPDIFISEEEASFINKENLVIICTGSQGEKRSALYRIAYNSHRHIHLESEDVVIFSSKDIPGNEKSINNLKNLLIRQKIEIITAEDDLVHVSGHGYAEEIKKMYSWTKPYISIPVHGEPIHLEAHKKISQASQVPITKILENGKCLKLAPGDCKIVEQIDTGKLIVEGKYIYDSDSSFIKERRKFSFEGLVLISLIINKDYTLDKNLILSTKGLPNLDNQQILGDFKIAFIEVYNNLNSNQKSSDEIVTDIIKKCIKKTVKNYLQKKPEVEVHLIRK